MTPVVYTVKTSKFTIAGTEYDVSTLALSLATNGIPKYTVGIASEPSQGTSGRSVVHALNLDSCAAMYRELQNKAMSLKECDLEIELEANEKLPDISLITRLDLKGWLLIGVGMTQITTTNAFSLSCTVAHPAYRLTLETGAISKNSGVIDFSSYCDDPKNPVEDPISASKQAIKACREANGFQDPVKTMGTSVNVSTDTKDLGKAIEEINSRLKAVEQNVDLIEWDKNGLYVSHSDNIPGKTLLSDVEDGIKYALVSDWVNGMFDCSYWDTLVGRINPEYGCEILPTYDREDKKLVVCPSFPWKDTDMCTIELPDDMSYSLTLPSQDMDPIFGYVASSNWMAPAGALVTVWAAGAEKTATVPAQIAFVPKNTQESTGRISQVNLPRWLDTARQRGSRTKHTNGVIKKTQNYVKGAMSMPVAYTGGDNKQLGKWEPAAFAYLSSFFMLEYKRAVMARLQCPFFTKINGKTIFPGQRLKFVTGGTPLFYGTITTVRHLISCAASSAETQIELSHCIFAGGGDSQIIGAQAKEPIYQATGNIEW